MLGSPRATLSQLCVPAAPIAKSAFKISLDKEGILFFDEVYHSQKKRIFNALKSSSSDSVIKFKNVLKKIIDGK